MNSRRDLRGTWPRALGGLALSILIILTIRWALLEPYVIPSGSMIPTLLIHDQILVNKFSYGLHLPFTKSRLLTWAQPQRGEVLVFRSVEDDEKFLVKRVIGLPGDKIEVRASGELVINGKPVARKRMNPDEVEAFARAWTEATRKRLLEGIEVWGESLPGLSSSHPVLRESWAQHEDQGPYEVPADSLFMMGDNRDNSADSRVWGVLPIERVLGRASVIAVGCEETLADAKQVCNPTSIRWNRVFKRIE